MASLNLGPAEAAGQVRELVPDARQLFEGRLKHRPERLEAPGRGVLQVG